MKKLLVLALVIGVWGGAQSRTLVDMILSGSTNPLRDLCVQQVGRDAGCSTIFPDDRYQSMYEAVLWNKDQVDTEYCIDITDENWNIYPGFQAIACGKNMLSFYPSKYVKEVMHTTLPHGFQFNWRLWYKRTDGTTFYGGYGREGTVVVP